jgi:hypothetical protein
MKVQPNSTTKKASRLRGSVLWLWPVLVLFVFAQAGQPGPHGGFAQSASPQQAAALQDTAKSAQTTSAQAPAPERQTKQEIQASTTDERKKQIADESANLLSLANSLKAEMDKTTKDMLSVTVVRKADEIERLAHKMRTK